MSLKRVVSNTTGLITLKFIALFCVVNKSLHTYTGSIEKVNKGQHTTVFVP